MKNNQDHFNVLRTIKNKSEASQREMAKDLGFSLGKLNYCLKALQKKGLIKINNFKKILTKLIISTCLRQRESQKKVNSQ